MLNRWMSGLLSRALYAWHTSAQQSSILRCFCVLEWMWCACMIVCAKAAPLACPDLPHFEGIERASNEIFADYHSLLFRRNVSKVCRRWMNVSLSEAFDTWREHAAHQAKLERAAVRIMKHWRNKFLDAAFEAWWCNASELRHHGCILEKFALRFLNRILSMAFLSWKDNALRQARAERIINRVVAHWTHSRTANAFQTWFINSKSLARAHNILARVLLRWTQLMLSEAFMCWRNEARRSAIRYDSAHRLLARWAHHGVIGAFSTFRCNMLMWRDLRRKLDNKLDLLDFTFTRRYWTRWREHFSIQNHVYNRTHESFERHAALIRKHYPSRRCRIQRSASWSGMTQNEVERNFPGFDLIWSQLACRYWLKMDELVDVALHYYHELTQHRFARRDHALPTGLFDAKLSGPMEDKADARLLYKAIDTIRAEMPPEVKKISSRIHDLQHSPTKSSQAKTPNSYHAPSVSIVSSPRRAGEQQISDPLRQQSASGSNTTTAATISRTLPSK